MKNPTPVIGVVDILDSQGVRKFLVEQQQPPEAVPMPFHSWNAECRDAGGGIGPALGWHVTIAGGTGVGKTVVALNCAGHAIDRGYDVGIVSLEMSRVQLQARTLAILTGQPVSHLERGAAFDIETFHTMAKQVRGERGCKGKLWVNEHPISKLQDIIDLMGRYVDRGCKLIIVDYLQLVRAPNAESLLQQTTTVSARVREFASSRGVLTLALSQFNRQTSANYQDSPRLQGLMGGSPIENDSDQVLLLDHSRMKRQGSTAMTWLLLAKNRHGANTEIPIEFDYRSLRVREALPDEEEMWPK